MFTISCTERFTCKQPQNTLSQTMEDFFCFNPTYIKLTLDDLLYKWESRHHTIFCAYVLLKGNKMRLHNYLMLRWGRSHFLSLKRTDDCDFLEPSRSLCVTHEASPDHRDAVCWLHRNASLLFERLSIPTQSMPNSHPELWWLSPAWDSRSRCERDAGATTAAGRGQI